jgi:hypothetical protein
VAVAVAVVLGVAAGLGINVAVGVGVNVPAAAGVTFGDSVGQRQPIALQPAADYKYEQKVR